jgi:cytoskeletal protein CcmA (bactofilin family)
MNQRARLILACAIFLLPTCAFANSQQPENIVVPSGERIRDNFVRVGISVEVHGDIEGDLIVAGQTIRVDGSVAGDVIAAAQSVHILGPVGGNIRVAAGDVTIGSTVGKNATIFGNTIELTDDARIGWSMQAFGTAVDVGGTVSGNANIYASSATIRGEIRGLTRVSLGEQGTLRISSGAVLEKDLTYRSSHDAIIDPGASIKGTTSKLSPVVAETKIQSFVTSLVSLWRLVSLFGVLVVGLVLLSFFPKSSERIVAVMKERPWKSFGWGAVALVGIPVACLLLLFTIIGIPLVLLVVALYGVLLYCSKVYAGFYLGRWLIGLFRREKPVPAMWAMILGIVVFTFLTMIPFVGWVASCAGALMAVGAIVFVKREETLKSEKA